MALAPGDEALFACYTKKSGIYRFKGLGRGRGKSIAQQSVCKWLVFKLQASLGIRFFEPGGQGFESLRAHFLSKSSSAALATRSEPADRTPDGQQDGSTTRRRAGLDVAASAAAVRSEAEDERRSREQSGRAHHSNLVEATSWRKRVHHRRADPC